MNPKKFWTAMVLAAVIVFGFFLFTKPKQQRLEPDMILRSKKYSETLGTQPFKSLSPEQKLLLIHAWYNLKNYPEIIKNEPDMVPVLRALPQVRREPFAAMIEDSYRRTGQTDKISHFQDELK